MAAVGKRLSGQFHWVTLTVIVVAVGFLIFVVSYYSRNVAIG
jgi:hypothetical protein